MPQPIAGYHHVNITVPVDRLKEARHFYVNVLGLPEIHRPDVFTSPGFWVRVGDADLHVGVEKDVNRYATRAHIAYQVTDLETWRAFIQSTGLEIEIPPQFAGVERFLFRDPFGNRIELIQPTCTLD